MDTTAATMHPAEEYLRNEQNPPVLYVRIYGERRKLFINRGGENVIGIIAKGKRKHGYIFSDWNRIEKIYYPSQEKVAQTPSGHRMGFGKSIDNNGTLLHARKGCDRNMLLGISQCRINLVTDDKEVMLLYYLCHCF